MSSQNPQERSLEYSIPLPIDEAIRVSQDLKNVIWEIAQQEGVEDTLKEANFDVRIGKPAIDLHAVITVVVTYVTMKTIDNTSDKIYDKVWDSLTTKILPALNKKFGKPVLILKKDKQKKD